MPVKIHNSYNPNDIVISGISGTFPQSDNIEEFKNHLFSGKDLISEVSRWDKQKVLGRMGPMKNIDRFDNDFFKMDHKEVESMNTSTRLLLERIFEAVIDAGYNLQQINGKNIAVICGLFDIFVKNSKTPDEDDESATYMKYQPTPANAISRWFGLHGPSVTLDNACSTSHQAIDYAIKAMKNGDCEAALVCASNICLAPPREYLKIGILSPTGICRPFDADGNGITRAEASVAIFLQKRKNARRIYATLIHSKCNHDGFKEEGMACPSVKPQKQLYESFYKEINVNPKLVSFLETHGTGTKVGDVTEGTSVEEFFGANRETPLKIGTVKSNMGHGEAAAGLCSLAKMIIAFEQGTIPPNINFDKPNPNIKGLHNGKLEVIIKPTPVTGEYFAISSFGVGGSSAHILISPHNKTKKNQDEFTDNSLPKLVTVSGRTEESLDCFLNDLEKNHKDYEYIRLIHEIFSDDIDGYFHRGYIISNQNGNHIRSKKFLQDGKRPLWFIFSGVGSQWLTMGVALMKIPLFAESIYKIHKTLESRGVNLSRILTSNDPQIMRNVLNSYVGIVAIQIALIDVLDALGITPDGVIGHSIGEIACAYADGCLTAEQTILIAYYCGLVSLEAEFIHSSMVVVGQGYNVIRKLIPSQIDITCHNGPNSCTISGPTDIIQEFIEELIDKQIPVYEVQSSNIAYHSRFIASSPLKLISHFKKVILEPKLRSEKWLCTSALENLWCTDELRYCSPQYFTNSFLNPVYFEETCRHIPNNAIAIEIGPYGYLNDVLKCSLPCAENIPLTTRSRENGVLFFLNALGQMYEAGCALKLDNLYPPVEFPVSKTTPMISPFIKWQHDKEWPVGLMKNENNSLSTVRYVNVNSKSIVSEFITGHIIDERNLYPGFGYLELVWDVVADMMNKKANELSIVFENIRFERATNIPKQGAVKFCITVHLGEGTFEITESGALVALGNVRIPNNISHEAFNMEPFEDEISNSQILPLNTKDFYKELRLRGYQYKGMFKKVVYANATGTYGKVIWNDNFTTFMDTMAQISVVHVDCRQLLVPTSIRKLVIDVNKHNKMIATLDKENPEVSVNFYPSIGLINSGGVQIMGFGTNDIVRRPDKADPVLEMHTFVPFICEEEMDLNLVIRLCVHIALENLPTLQVRTYELLDQEYNKDASVSNIIEKTLADLPLIQASVNILTNSEIIKENENENEKECCNGNGVKILKENLPEDNSSLIIFVPNIQTKIDLLEKIFRTLKEDGFIITKESRNENRSFIDLGLDVCFSRPINLEEKILLLRKIKEKKYDTKTIKMNNDSFGWISEVQTALIDIKPQEGEKLIIYAEKEPTSGILGFHNCLRKEEKGSSTRCFFIVDKNAPDFTLENSFYKSQLDKNLSQNVFKNGKWGSYRHLPVETVKEIEVRSAFCEAQKRGDFSSFKWLEDSMDPAMYENSTEKSLVHVYFSSLNFRDVMLAIGKVSVTNYRDLYSRLREGHQGLEYSGKDANGRRLMGIIPTKGIATMVETLPDYTWTVPNWMSLEAAASIPVVYCTVIYALFFKIQLKKGSSILIHAGTGGIGQAAINICLHYGCNIFTTVGTPEKVEFIKKNFPQIPESQICNSRDTSFEIQIMNKTNGKGVDVVLNSLSEEKLKASLRCVAKGGHFLEIGKYDIFRNNRIDMGSFLKNITFYSIQLDALMMKKTNNTQNFQKKLQEMLDQKIVKPIHRTIFQNDEVESAFRFMAAGKHIGKVMIKIRDEEEDLHAKPVLLHIKATARVLCERNKSYIIIGGLGGFGLELADWLILRGARNIVLSSRTGIKNGYQSYRVKLWRSYGVNVEIYTDNVTKEEGVKNLLLKANSLGPVAGIFNVALILKDDPFPKQSDETFELVAGPKSTATVHLDKLSRKLCPYLEHFVIFSSVSCGRGNLNQTNYGFANSIMERICEQRNLENLSALVIQWGAIGEVGVVADFAEDNLNIVIGGTLQQNVRSCLDSLNLFMKQSNPIVSSIIVAEKRHADSDIINTIANILGIKDLKTISLTWTLPELGMDSIIGLEIKQILESEFNTFFGPDDLRTMTFAKLYKLKEEKKNSKSGGIGPINPQFQNVILDVELMKQPILHIPINHQEIQKTTPALFIFPGVEGLATFMEPLMKNLSLQAWCFQYFDDELPLDSFKKLAEYFVKLILEKIGPDEEFCVIGYSLGGLYALETIGILEKIGRKGYLWLIDSSPLFFAMKKVDYYNKNKLESIEDKTMQNHVCNQILKSLAPGLATEEYFAFIEKATSWELKKKAVFSLMSHIPVNDEIKNNILDRSYHLNKMIQDYEYCSRDLETKCTFIRTEENLYDLDESYGLNEYFKNPVQVHKIAANHDTILENQRTADIIMDCPVWRNK
ncbi:fatty acid synthase-like [Planococcus citri]|uniref:fatty acid synthase-like n=1 Tax=Planococcus citri TaxID=170843 RepID=UPI0031F8C5A9